jgi:hypothetical protein
MYALRRFDRLSAVVRGGNMTKLEIICEHKNASKLEVVWRNPSPVRRHRRRHKFDSGGDYPHYILQEFVDDDHLGHWATISDFEVVVGGGRAA